MYEDEENLELIDNPAELLLIGNPRRRRRKGGRGAKSHRRASRKQLAARARFAAMSRSRSRRRNPPIAVANPRRRRRSLLSRVTRRRTRRNPIGFRGFRGTLPMLRAAGWGATGAIVNDVAYGFAVPFLPAMFSSPVSAAGGINPGYYAGKLGTALLLGAIGGKLAGARAATMTEGALTVTLRDAIKQLLISFGLAIPMGALNPGRVLPPLPIHQSLRAAPRMGKYIGATAARGMGLYVVGNQASTGSREMMTR